MRQNQNSDISTSLVWSNILSVHGLKRTVEVLVQAPKDLMADNGTYWAASIAYYALLSGFPLILAMVTVASFFINPDWAVKRATDLMSSYVPQGAGWVEQVVTDVFRSRAGMGLLSVLSLVWAGTRVFSAVTRALNIAFNVEEKYGLIQRTLIELLMFVTLGVFFILTLAAPLLLRLLSTTLQLLPEGEGTISDLVLDIAPIVLLILAFFLTYRFVPRTKVHSLAALFGATIAALLFAIARPLFLYYINTFARYNLVYGSLAIVIIIVFWVWIAALILLLGGELVSRFQAVVLEENQNA